MRVAMILPGLGRVRRGAETAFLELARALDSSGEASVQLFGSGREGVGHLSMEVVDCVPRERFEGWPKLPAFRSEYHYEEFTFARNLARSGAYRPDRFDVALSCTFPHVHWMLRRAGRRGAPSLVFATQNGDWMCRDRRSEFRFFRCDGLVCLNPDHYEANRVRHRAALIPNGVDPARFMPRAADDACRGVEEGLPPGPVVLMAAALAESKRVEDGIRAVSGLSGANLIVAGDGPRRREVAALAAGLLPGRHKLLGAVSAEAMPEVFRSADAFLHMSRDEPFGIVYLEAAATGLPIVAQDGRVPRWVLGDHALFVDTSDPAAVVGALRSALDPGVGPPLGAQARRRVVDGWSWRIQAARYLDFFRAVREARDATTKEPAAR